MNNNTTNVIQTYKYYNYNYFIKKNPSAIDAKKHII